MIFYNKETLIEESLLMQGYGSLEDMGAIEQSRNSLNCYVDRCWEEVPIVVMAIWPMRKVDADSMIPYVKEDIATLQGYLENLQEVVDQRERIDRINKMITWM